MAIPRTGALGAAALGSLSLGAPLVWQTATPPTGRIRSAVSDPSAPKSAVSATGVRSSISAASVRGGVE